MRYLGEADENELMGIGYSGELRLGADGHLYQWTEERDGLGNVFGSWRRLRRVGRRVQRGVRRALPVVERVASAIPLPQAQAVAAGIRRARPVLRRAGLAANNGLGALYQAPNGAVYQVSGLDQDEELLGPGQDELMEVAGIGSLGEVRLGADGYLYQWTEENDGLGNVVGSWRRLRRAGRRIQRGVRRALPVVERVASAIPLPQTQAVAAGIRKARPLLRRAGLAADSGLGALYQAPDGTLYQVEDLGELAQGEELYDLAEDEELEGMGQDEELYGLAEDEEFEDLEGYIREDGVDGLEAYVPEEPPTTRKFVRPAQSPEIWRPLW
jgi:hypothetical protein